MPEKAKELDDFYLQRLLEYMSSDPSALWFYASPVGEQKLGGMVKDMFTKINQMQQQSVFTLQNQGSSAQGPTFMSPLLECC